MSTQFPDHPSGNDDLALEWFDGDMPYSPRFGDHFYCRSDGRLECAHVFIAGNGLPERWREPRPFRIGELGFGTGLNFCETWRQWKQTRDPAGYLSFTSFELYPMPRAAIDRALARWPEIDSERQALTALWPDEPQGIVTIDVDPQTQLNVVCAAAMDGLAAWQGSFDAFYLDGFAPSRNPEMWSEDLMRLVHAKVSPGGSFATYAAAGFVRRNLASAGFVVERPPGFAGKREMLRGTRTSGTP